MIDVLLMDSMSAMVVIFVVFSHHLYHLHDHQLLLLLIVSFLLVYPHQNHNHHYYLLFHLTLFLLKIMVIVTIFYVYPLVQLVPFQPSLIVNIYQQYVPLYVINLKILNIVGIYQISIQSPLHHIPTNFYYHDLLQFEIGIIPHFQV